MIRMLLAISLILLIGPSGRLGAEDGPVFRGAAWGQSPGELEAGEAARPDSEFLGKSGSIKTNYMGFPVELFSGWQFYSYAVKFADLVPADVSYAFPAETGDLRWVMMVIPLPCPGQPDDLACSSLVRDELNRSFGQPKENEHQGYLRVFWQNPRLAAFGLFPAAGEREKEVRSLAVILAAPSEAVKSRQKLEKLLLIVAEGIGHGLGRAYVKGRQRPAPARDRSTSQPPRNSRP